MTAPEFVGAAPVVATVAFVVCLVFAVSLALAEVAAHWLWSLLVVAILEVSVQVLTLLASNCVQLNAMPHFKIISSTYLDIILLYTLTLCTASLMLFVLILPNNSLNVSYPLSFNLLLK